MLFSAISLSHLAWETVVVSENLKAWPIWSGFRVQGIPRFMGGVSTIRVVYDKVCHNAANARLISPKQCAERQTSLLRGRANLLCIVPISSVSLSLSRSLPPSLPPALARSLSLSLSLPLSLSLSRSLSIQTYMLRNCIKRPRCKAYKSSVNHVMARRVLQFRPRPN